MCGVRMVGAKITVLKRLSTGDIWKEYSTMEELCPFVKEGQVFTVGENLAMPEGFCSWAWADIQRDIIHIALGGDYFWIKNKGTAVACCTDGLRPVVFKIERT